MTQHTMRIFRVLIFALLILFSAQPVFAIVPNDPDFFRQWYLPHIFAPRAWEYSQGSYDVVVAVLDTGVDIHHPDLRDNIWVNTKEKPYDQIDNDGNGYVDDFYGWNFIDNSNNIEPKISDALYPAAQHGTIVAGIIGARAANDIGIAGMSWQVKIMPITVLNNQGRGDAVHVAQGIDYAVAQGADVINLSFVGSDYSYELEQAIARAYRAGVVVVAASGNEGEAGKDLAQQAAYPVCYDNGENMVLGVAALDHLNQLTVFSNYGARCIDVAAPGVSFYSTQVYRPESDLFQDAYGGGWNGTSVAAPLVSGLAALIKAKNPSLTPAQLYSIIINSADSVDELQRDEYKGKIGSGRINAEQSLAAAQATLGTMPTRALERSYVVVGPAQDGGPHVRVLDYNGNVLNQWFAYEPYFRGGVSIATGDVDNDGTQEIITMPLGNHVPLVRIFDLQGVIEYEFMAYNENFRGGGSVAVGDVNADGVLEIITGAGPGGGPHVRIFTAKGEVLDQFMAYDADNRSGVFIAAGNVDADDSAEIITGLGSGSEPLVRVFTKNGEKKHEFLAYATDFRGGVRVSVGEVARSQAAEIITTPAASGGPHVRIFTASGGIVSQWFAGPSDLRTGLSTAVVDSNGDGLAEIVVGRGVGQDPRVNFYDWLGNSQQTLTVYNPIFRGGVLVAPLVQ